MLEQDQVTRAAEVLKRMELSQAKLTKKEEKAAFLEILGIEEDLYPASEKTKPFGNDTARIEKDAERRAEEAVEQAVFGEFEADDADDEGAMRYYYSDIILIFF